MACFKSGTIIELGAREAITLQDLRGSTLRVTRGTVWITQESDRDDVILRTGDNWVVERDGATVLESQDDKALVYVVGRDVTPAAARWRRGRAGALSWRDRVATYFLRATRSAWPYM
jgi:hypothetical protein